MMNLPIDNDTAHHIFPEQDLSSLHILGTALYKNHGGVVSQHEHAASMYGYHHAPQHPQPFVPQLCMLLDTPVIATQSNSPYPQPQIPMVDFTQNYTELPCSPATCESPSISEPYVIAKLPISLYHKILDMLQIQQHHMPQALHIEAPAHDPSILETSPYTMSPSPILPMMQQNFGIKSSPTKLRDDEEFHIKGSWTEEEDKRLIDLVKKHGAKRWSFIATHLKGRIGKQCRERYLNHLDPRISKKAWTTEEDSVILDMHKKYGNQWAKISRMLSGRTANAIKNHWNSTLSRRLEITGSNINKVKKEDSMISTSQEHEDISVDIQHTHPFNLLPQQDSIVTAQQVMNRKRTLQEYNDSQQQIQQQQEQFKLTECLIAQSPPAKKARFSDNTMKLETDENMSEFSPYGNQLDMHGDGNQLDLNGDDNKKRKYDNLRVQLQEESNNSNFHPHTVDTTEEFDLNLICATPKIGDCALNVNGGQLSGGRYMTGTTSHNSSFLSPTSQLLLPSTPDATTQSNNNGNVSTRSASSEVEFLWSPKSTKNSNGSGIICS
jgi:hypothetical protein